MEVISLEQNTEEWLLFRKDHIGASDAPIIMGVSPWKTPFQLWEEKLALGKPQAMNAAMKRGHDLEPLARETYIFETGVIVEPVVARSSEYPWMAASFDGLSLDRKRIVEIKCPNAKDHELAKNGQVPAYYYPQLQHQMVVAQLDSVDYVSFRDGDIAIVTVKRDDEYIEELLEKEKAFFDMVTNLEAPPISESDYVQREDEDWLKSTQEWKEIKQELDRLSDLEKAHRNRLIDLSDGRSTKGNGVSLKMVMRKGTVNYSKIQELKSVDLEKYRGKPVTSWRLTCSS